MNQGVRFAGEIKPRGVHKIKPRPYSYLVTFSMKLLFSV
jgi:hypothetical protein